MNAEAVIQEAIEEWASIHSCSKPSPSPTLARYIAAKLADQPPTDPNGLEALVNSAEAGQRFMVIREGRRKAVLIGFAEYERMCRHVGDNPDDAVIPMSAEEYNTGDHDGDFIDRDEAGGIHE